MLGAAPYTSSTQELPKEQLDKITSDSSPVCEDEKAMTMPVSDDTVCQKPDVDSLVDKAQPNGTYKDPYAGINFVERHPVIKGADGVIKFDQVVTFPDYFSEQSVKVVASKYLCNNAKRKEADLRDMLDRVSDTTAALAKKDGYIEDEKSFSNKLKYYQIHQYAAFNSPVYFNQGVAEKNQLSACFILSVEDNMESIANLYKDEMMVFKKGSGSGVNFSPLRSSFEKVGKADKSSASGPISFLKASDVSASVVKSGGILRRAAKMACLNADHPDIFKFINCKKKEEDKLNAIKAAGILPEASYELSDEVFFQSSNLSVRFSNKFMEAVESDGYWSTREVLTGDIVETVKARDLLMQVSEIAHKTGDPGVMFHDTINDWNTTPADGVINASNPCGEYNGQDNTSCNLAALNLIKFFKLENGRFVFDYDRYYDVVSTMIIAQDVFVDNASYPTEKITQGTKRFRALGFGPANLGGLLLYLGIPYDSDKGRIIASLLISIITGIGHITSAEIAKKLGPGEWWNNVINQDAVYRILNKHKQYTDELPANKFNDELVDTLYEKAVSIWNEICNEKRPLRCSQVTVCMPNGTTGFLMGISGFGIEPIYSNIIYKTLSGSDGAVIKMVNDDIKVSLQNLRYTDDTIIKIISEVVDENIPFEKSKYLKSEHISIFDTAASPENGTRYITANGHISMLQAIQPVISGGISKTINLPNGATVEDVYNNYLDCWRRGLKSVTVYRDRSKTEQIMTTSLTKTEAEHDHTDKPYRKRMPIDRNAKIHKFTINGNVEGYIIAGVYEDGSLGELFIEGTSFGSTLGGFTDSLSIVTSMALQHGVPLDVLVKKLMHTRFEPAGFSANPNIRVTSSLVDYIFRYLALEFLPDDKLVELGLKHSDDINTADLSKSAVVSGSPCPVCSSLMVRLGSCEQCLNGCYSSGSCG